MTDDKPMPRCDAGLTMRLPHSDLEWLRRLAAAERRTPGAMVRLLLEEARRRDDAAKAEAA